MNNWTLGFGPGVLVVWNGAVIQTFDHQGKDLAVDRFIRCSESGVPCGHSVLRILFDKEGGQMHVIYDYGQYEYMILTVDRVGRVVNRAPYDEQAQASIFGSVYDPISPIEREIPSARWNSIRAFLNEANGAETDKGK